jgi:hypothetical protein
MATTTLSPIEIKKQKKTDTVSALTNNNNWGGFGVSLLVNLIVTVVVGLVGSNFIYLTRSASATMGKTSTVLEFLLPTKQGVYFPDTKVKEETNAYIKNLNSAMFANCGRENTCEKAEPCTNYKRLAKFNIGTLGGWPYSMRDPKVPAPWGLWSQFKYWLADSVADSYIRDRDYLQKFLTTFAPEKGGGNMFANQSFQMFVITPLMYIMTPLIMLFIFCSSLFSLFATSPGWAICGIFFFLSTFVINYGIFFVQAFQYMCTLTFVPLLADFKMVQNIFKCNGNSLIYFFMFLTCISAFANLEGIIAGTIVGVYGVYILYKVFKTYW